MVSEIAYVQRIATAAPAIIRQSERLASRAWEISAYGPEPVAASPVLSPMKSAKTAAADSESRIAGTPDSGWGIESKRAPSGASLTRGCARASNRNEPGASSSRFAPVQRARRISAAEAVEQARTSQVPSWRSHEAAPATTSA